MRSGWTMTPLSHCKSSTFKTPHSWQIQCKCLDYRIFSFWYSPFFYFHGHNGSSLCDFPCSDSSYWSGFRESQVLLYNMNENTNRPACSPSSVVLLRRTTPVGSSFQTSSKNKHISSLFHCCLALHWLSGVVRLHFYTPEDSQLRHCQV